MTLPRLVPRPAPFASALTACPHAPAGPTNSGIACAYFRLPASPAVATAAVIDACTRQVGPRPRVSESAITVRRTSGVCSPSAPRPLSLPLAHRLRSCPRCHHPDSSSAASRASLIFPMAQTTAGEFCSAALQSPHRAHPDSPGHIHWGPEIDWSSGRSPRRRKLSNANHQSPACPGVTSVTRLPAAVKPCNRRPRRVAATHVILFSSPNLGQYGSTRAYIGTVPATGASRNRVAKQSPIASDRVEA